MNHQKINNYTKAAILLGSILTLLAGAIVTPVLPIIAVKYASYPHVELLTKMVIALPALSVALTSPFSGYLVDKFGRKKPMIYSIILFTISGCSAYWLDNLYYILITRFVLGIAIAGLSIACITLIGDYFIGEERKNFMGIQSSFMSLGGIFLLPLGGYLADLYWKNPFLMYLSALLVLPIVYYHIYDQKKIITHADDPLEIGEVDFYRTIIILVLAFISMIIFYMSPVQVPFLLKDLGVHKNVLYGLAIATGATFATVGSFMYGMVKSKLNYMNIYTLSFLLIGAGYICLSYSWGFYSLLPGMVISGLGIGFIIPNANLWIVEISPSSHRGRMVGAVSTTGFLGLFFSPIIIQPLIKYFSLSEIFGMAGFASIGIALICFSIHKKI